MKTKIGLLLLALCITLLNVNAQRRVVTTTRAMSYDISDNLDLDAVASIFGDSQDLEDFEYRLNDPDNRISNLDLNGDGYIDYLRVVENSSDRNSLVVIQAVLDEDVYQDVATIEIEKVRDGHLRVQVVGDAYIYGNNYIIEPVYVGSPVIFSFFWGPRYRPYYSPYYWNYYPRWYSYYEPYPTYKYHRHVYRHINTHYEYHHTTDRFIHFSDDRYSKIRRSDYASRYPDRAFSNRHEGLQNKYELERRRPTNNNITGRSRNGNADRVNSGRTYENKRGTINGNNKNYDDIYDNSRRPSSVKSGGTNRERTRTSGDSDYSGRRGNSSNDKPYVKPESRTGSSQTDRSEQNSRIENNRRSRSSEAPEQIKSGRINESDNGGAVSRNRTMPSSGSNRSGNQIDSRTSTPREKSGSVVSRSNRVNSEVKQNQNNTRKQEAPKREENKENGNGRRR